MPILSSYRITLTLGKGEQLESLCHIGRATAWKIFAAHPILLSELHPGRSAGPSSMSPTWSEGPPLTFPAQVYAAVPTHFKHQPKFQLKNFQI